MRLNCENPTASYMRTVLRGLTLAVVCQLYVQFGVKTRWQPPAPPALFLYLTVTEKCPCAKFKAGRDYFAFEGGT